MKKLKIMLLALLSVVMIISCSDQIVSNSKSSETIEVSFDFNGEVDSITQVPLQTRALDSYSSAESKNWYAIQVYDENGVPYAYGFFDNMEDMRLQCIRNATYSFTVDMIPNAEGYVKYFSLTKAGWATIGNSFYYSKTDSVRFLGTGYLYMRSPKADPFNRPSVDRFYGQLSGYKAVKNGKVNINLTRSAFSVKFVAKEFTEGTLELAIDNAPSFYLKTGESNVFEHFYSFNNLSSSFEEIGVSIIWTNGDGKRIPLVGQNITFSRNTRTTLEFTVKAPESSNTFSINANEELLDGEIIQLEPNDDLVDTEIETNK